jgi:hypothetical protein
VDGLDATGLANDLEVHRGAADLAVLDGGVVALGGVGGGGDDLAAMGALDLDGYDHLFFLVIKNNEGKEAMAQEKKEVEAFRTL